MNVVNTLSNKADLVLNLSGDECNMTEIIYNSIFAEVINPANVGKIITKITLDNCSIKIHVEADTISHLRAFLNSILYLINTSIGIIKIGKEFKQSQTQK
jgi:tRNA threonylcarbamoyladenosine modification (KEOPS) complex  Pcc1 subunit|uniref:KEOPS complex Pcc1-like subunit n=1 Tax=Ignisphaera aggregans TaxID=334771 RepID=A0A7J2U0H9_9CREN